MAAAAGGGHGGASSAGCGAQRPGCASYYRRDGVRRTTSVGLEVELAAKYGEPGRTDDEGFDPYADTVGPGIYSGCVQRRFESDGSVVIGDQYQRHNPKPGPVYSGSGYAPISRAIALFRSELAGGIDESQTTLGKLLDMHPDLVNDVSTGGAVPLHTCGMSVDNQHATAFVISRGGDIEAVDTYGYTPLHRMASNNLAIGAKALLEAGAAVDHGDPMKVAKDSAAAGVIEVLEAHAKGYGKARPAGTTVAAMWVFAPQHPEISGRYHWCTRAAIPPGFRRVCEQQGWDPEATWEKLNGADNGVWFSHMENKAYIYLNSEDGLWWIDSPDGSGVYKGKGTSWSPAGSSIRWTALDGSTDAPTLAIYRS